MKVMNRKIKEAGMKGITITDKMNLEQCYRIVFEALETGNGIVRAVKDMAEGLGITIVIVDPCGQILADSYTEADQMEEEILQKEQISWGQMITDYYAAGVEENAADGCRNRVIFLKNGMKVMSPVLIKEILEGFCITYHSGETKKQDAVILNGLVCRAMAIGFGWKNRVHHLEEPSAKQIVSKLLLGRQEDAKMLPEISEEAYWSYAPEPYILLLVKASGNSSFARNLRCRMLEKFPEALAYADGDRLEILFTSVDDAKKEKIQKQTRLFMDGQERSSALSEIFNSREQIRTKERMLERLIRIGVHLDSTKEVYTEYDYYIELICSYAYEEIGSCGYCYRELDILSREDREKGTEFYQTLKEYLLAGNNVNLAAKKMFVHRNTMVYRLSRIHEMIGRDINNPDIAKRLLLSMIIEGFNKKSEDDL